MTKQKNEQEVADQNFEGVTDEAPKQTPTESPQDSASGGRGNEKETDSQNAAHPQDPAGKLKKLEQYKKAASSGKTLVSGSEYWDFEAEPYFVGRWTERYAKREKRPKDKPEDIEKDGKVIIGLIFESELDGEEWIIGNSYAVTKALKILEKDGDVTVPILIEFKGKTETADGQPYNNFHIVAL